MRLYFLRPDAIIGQYVLRNHRNIILRQMSRQVFPEVSFYKIHKADIKPSEALIIYFTYSRRCRIDY